jgi:hypothetical protein
MSSWRLIRLAEPPIGHKTVISSRVQPSSKLSPTQIGRGMRRRGAPHKCLSPEPQSVSLGSERMTLWSLLSGSGSPLYKSEAEVMLHLLSSRLSQTLRRILLGTGTAFFQQVGGTNVIAYYLSVILTRSVGLSIRMSLIISHATPCR